MNILLLGQYAPELIEALRHSHKIVQVESGPIDRALADAEIIVMRSHLDLTARHIAAAPDLKLIIKAGSGFDNIDMEAARRRGVKSQKLAAAFYVECQYQRQKKSGGGADRIQEQLLPG